MERALFAAYPTVTVINIADVLSRIETVVDQITFVVRFLAGFSILAGLMILASSIASARFRRMREAVVLKTLGATRMRIVRTFSVEFSVLGLLAGSVGVVFANILTRVLLRRLEVAFHLDWSATLFALVGTAVLATATGWIASYRILGLQAARGAARRIAPETWTTRSYPLELLRDFHRWQDVVLACHPDIKRGHQKNADDQVRQQPADDHDCKWSLRVRTNGMRKRCGKQA